MKKRMILTALASAIMILPAAASADAGRTSTGTFNFPAIGHGDVTGLCLGPAFPAPQLDSCVEGQPLTPVAPSTAIEDHVTVDVRDANGAPVYFSIQQEGGDFGWGCGNDLASHANGEFPILGLGVGGADAPPVLVFPWAGPGLHRFPGTLDPNDLCSGSTTAGGGTVTFTWHNHVYP